MGFALNPSYALYVRFRCSPHWWLRRHARKAPRRITLRDPLFAWLRVYWTALVNRLQHGGTGLVRGKFGDKASTAFTAALASSASILAALRLASCVFTA